MMHRLHALAHAAGVDVHKEDALGKLALSNDGILQRDRTVLAAAAERGVPVAAAIGGGYEPRHAHIVERHMCLHLAAAELLPQILAAQEARRGAARRGRGGA
jgi:acetoin utilization deacetylase AcuC-like enzyme